MIEDSTENTCHKLDALLTKCRAGVDTYAQSQDSTCSRLRTVLYELHQAVYLFDKHKGYGFSLQSCLTVFDYLVAGLPEILDALSSQLEHQSARTFPPGQLSVQIPKPDELTLANILEQLEYYNFCVEVLSTALTRGHDGNSALWKAENSIRRLRGALDAFFQPPVRIKNAMSASGVWTLDKTQAAQFEHAQHLAQILGTSIASSTDSIKSPEELCTFRIKLAIHWYLTQCSIQHSSTTVDSTRNELLRVFDGIKGVWLIHDSLISVPGGDCGPLIDMICVSLEDTVLLQLERQYTHLATIDYGYIVENADYGIVPKFMSAVRTPDIISPPDITSPPDVLFISLPASRSDRSSGHLSEPQFYSPIITRSPPVTFPQIKAPSAPSLLSVEAEVESTAQSSNENEAELSSASLGVPAAVLNFKSLNEVCSIDDEVEIENRETWDGFVEGIMAKSTDLDIGDVFAPAKVRIFRSHRNSSLRVWLEASNGSLYMITLNTLTDEIVPNYAWDEITQPSLELTLRYSVEKKEVRFRFPPTEVNVAAPSILYAFQGALTSSDFEGEYLIKSASFAGTLIPDTKNLRIQLWTETQQPGPESETTNQASTGQDEAVLKRHSLDPNRDTMSKTPCSKIYMFSEDQIYAILITDRVKVESVTEGDRRNRHVALTKLALSPNTEKGYSAIPFRIIRPSIGRHAGLRLDHEGMRTYDQDTPKFTECSSITLNFNSKASCTDFMANYLECKTGWDSKSTPNVPNALASRDRRVKARTRNILGGGNRASFFSALASS